MKVLSLLRGRGNLSQREISEILEYSRNAGNLSRAIKELLESGRIEYTIPDKRSSKNQRLRLKI